MICLTLFSYSGLAQDKPLLKEVLLDGKPAILNVRTGKITLTKGIRKNNKADVSKTEEHEKTKVNEVSVAVSNTNIESSPESDFHFVKAGETMFALSKQYNTTLTKLKEANNLSTTLLRVGQKLLVKNFDRYDSTLNGFDSWIVSKGDTLYSIAKKANTTVSHLKQLNGLKENTIFIGQILRLK